MDGTDEDLLPAAGGPIGSTVRRRDAPGRFRVRVSLGRLRANLSREDPWVKSPAEVVRFLSDAGFRPDCGGGSFTVDTARLGHPKPEEVLAIQPLM